jgi:hypothetical protein
MKHLITAAAVVLLSTLSTSAFADEPTLAQRIALTRMYDIETVKAHCPFAINFDKIDRDLSKFCMSIADYCPDGRFNEYGSPSLNEALSASPAILRKCAQRHLFSMDQMVLSIRIG